jgi:hypothetical protein
VPRHEAPRYNPPFSVGTTVQPCCNLLPLLLMYDSNVIFELNSVYVASEIVQTDVHKRSNDLAKGRGISQRLAGSMPKGSDNNNKHNSGVPSSTPNRRRPIF